MGGCDGRWKARSIFHASSPPVLNTSLHPDGCIPDGSEDGEMVGSERRGRMKGRGWKRKHVGRKHGRVIGKEHVT